MNENEVLFLKPMIEAVLMASEEPLSLDALLRLFAEEGATLPHISSALQCLEEEYRTRGIELIELARGYCFRTRQIYAPFVAKLWEEKPPKYSRALLETLAIIAYRQPITRAEIEDIRGVSVSTPLIKTLIERAWIRILGHRQVPGKPAVYGTTPVFLDYFHLKALSELPHIEEADPGVLIV